MKIMIIGTGYVGLVHAAVCSEFGPTVYGYDKNTEKINDFNMGQHELIEKHVYEPGLSNIVKDTLNKYLYFTSDMAEAIDDAEIVFMCLPTPANSDGSTDLSIYDACADELAGALAARKSENRIVVVNKSTVPIGTARHLERIFKSKGVRNVGVASNPEFLAEGTAVDQARRPDRVVVGCDLAEDFEILRKLYAQFYNHIRIKYIETTPETAEAIKYVANTMLLTYISFWNGVGARLGENVDNVNIDDLRLGVTADERISTWGSYVSSGAGGSCFGKDIRSLIYQLRAFSVDTKMLESSYEVNQHQKVYLIDRAISEAGFDFNNKTIAVVGLAFKKNTNDMRDSSSIDLIRALLGHGVISIRAYDSLALEEAKKVFDPSLNHLFSKIEYFDKIPDALEGTDALFVSSDSSEFRGLADTVISSVKKPYLVVDGRRIIADIDALIQNGISHMAVGSAYKKAKS